MNALNTMEEANKIIEDFSVQKYTLYMFLFAVEVIIAFVIGVNI
jgi:hypothetical protein